MCAYNYLEGEKIMKTKKLFLGLFCLGALVLGACSGNKSSESSIPPDDSSESQGVDEAIEAVSVDKQAAEIFVNGTHQITANLLAKSGETITDNSITYSTNDSAIVSISETGLVTGLAKGVATIKVAAHGNPDLFKIVQVAVMSAGFEIPAVTTDGYTLLTADNAAQFVDNSEFYIVGFFGEQPYVAKHRIQDGLKEEVGAASIVEGQLKLDNVTNASKFILSKAGDEFSIYRDGKYLGAPNTANAEGWNTYNSIGTGADGDPYAKCFLSFEGGSMVWKVSTTHYLRFNHNVADGVDYLRFFKDANKNVGSSARIYFKQHIHHLNEYGFCDASPICGYYSGTKLTLGSYSTYGNLAADTTWYGRFAYEAGKAYSFDATCGGGSDYTIHAYRRTGLATAEEVNLNGADELEEAFGRQYIYIVIHINTAVTQFKLMVFEGEKAPNSWLVLGFRVDRTYSHETLPLDASYARDLTPGGVYYARVPITSGKMYAAYLNSDIQVGEAMDVSFYSIFNNAPQKLGAYTGSGSNYVFFGDVLSQDGYIYIVGMKEDAGDRDIAIHPLLLISVDDNYFDADFEHFYGIEGFEAEDDTIEFFDDDVHIHNTDTYAFAFNAVPGDTYYLDGATLDSAVSYKMYEIHEVAGNDTLVELLQVDGKCTASATEVFVYLTFTRSIGAESFVVHQQHVTSSMNHGYCDNCHAWVGEDLVFTPAQNSLLIQDNDEHYYRFEFQTGHKYEIDYSTTSDYQVTYWIYNGSAWIETSYGQISVTGIASAQSIYGSSKKYIYITLQRTGTDPIDLDIDVEDVTP